MAKHRKTRQEKLIADHRHVTYHLETLPAETKTSDAKKSTYKLNLATTAGRVETTNYAFVAHDLRRTAMVTAVIIAAQIFLFIILNRV